MTSPAEAFIAAGFQRSSGGARDVPLAPDAIGGLEPSLPYLQRLIRTLIPADRTCTLLDLGCGYGALIHALREAGYRNIRGVDGSPEQVAAAKQLGIAGVEAGDIFDTLAQTGEEWMDVIVTFDVIEHFTKSELIPLVDHVFPGAQTWRPVDHPFTQRRGSIWRRVFFGDFTHELALTRTSLNQLLRASGFSRVECTRTRRFLMG